MILKKKFNGINKYKDTIAVLTWERDKQITSSVNAKSFELKQFLNSCNWVRCNLPLLGNIIIFVHR